MTRSHHAPAVGATDFESAANALRSRGLRLSTARRLLLEALFAAGRPLTAEQLAATIDGRLPRADLASVYRNLEVLEELGLVRHVHLGHGPGLYGPAASVEIEYVACHGCGAFRALTGAELEPAREAIRRATGYEAHFGHFPAVGRCPACQDVALDDASHLQ